MDLIRECPDCINLIVVVYKLSLLRGTRIKDRGQGDKNRNTGTRSVNLRDLESKRKTYFILLLRSTDFLRENRDCQIWGQIVFRFDFVKTLEIVLLSCHPPSVQSLQESKEGECVDDDVSRVQPLGFKMINTINKPI